MLRPSVLIIGVLLATLLLLSGSVGLGVAQETDQLCGREVPGLIDSYNSNADAIPGLMKGLAAEETIHLNISGDADRHFTAVTDDDARVSTFQTGMPDSPTVEVRTDCETINTIVDAGDSRAAFQEEHANGEIQVIGIGIVKAVLVEVVEIVVKLARIVGLL